MMTDDIDDGGPAFPTGAAVVTVTRDDGTKEQALAAVPGMSLRQYAAIKLCVPDSGTPWLDDMIRQAQRDRFAGQAMRDTFAALAAAGRSNFNEYQLRQCARMSYMAADVMLAAWKGE